MQHSFGPTLQWSDRFAFDIALRLENSGEELTDILKRHNVSVTELMKFNTDPVFLKKVDSYRNEIRDNGVTFKMKARAQAEELLTTSWVLIHSPDVSASVKADLIKSTVRWAGLESKSESDSGGNNGGVKIVINLAGQDVSATVIEPQPQPLEVDYAEEASEEA